MKNFTYIGYACYLSSVAMAIVTILSPLLFETFRELYGISYTLLGTLAVINFVTQLSMDIIFTLFSSRLNVKKIVKLTPFLTVFGLGIYSVMPSLFPDDAYAWLALGTVIFSASSGLCEVLLSPIIAAVPSENPERDMSKLHACYAWGVVGTVIFSTLFLKLVGEKAWPFLPIALCIVPLFAMLCFFKAEFPAMNMGSEKSVKKIKMRSKGIFLCFFCIFFGGAAEGAMTQWVSSYLEMVVGFSKVVGDILGVALFAVTLGLGRSLYAKYGKNIIKVMLITSSGAVLTYMTASLSTNNVIALLACIMTGVCVSMLWPGTLIIVGDVFPGASVAVYALMAAGGDLGISIAPQLVGAIADKMAITDIARSIADKFSLTTEQVAMRAGLLSASAFAFATVISIIALKVYFSKEKQIKKRL